jgi:hypothetical protein
MKPRYNEMTPDRLACLKAVSLAHSSMSHDDPTLLPFLDDNSTLTEPDTFNQCHDAGWLRSGYDDRTDSSYVRLTDAVRVAMSSPQSESGK